MKFEGPIPEKILRLMSPTDRKSFGRAGMSAEDALRKVELKQERDLQCVLVNLLRLRNIEPLWHRTNKKSAATIGWPDITFAVSSPVSPYPLFACVWEVKFGAGELEDEQKKMAVRLQSPPNFWRWRLIRSVDEGIADLTLMGL